MFAAIGLQAAESSETLSFANAAQRTSFSTTQQIWEQNGIKFTNNKGTGNNIGNYTNPIRCYANSEIIIDFEQPMTRLEFSCATSGYAAVFEKSIASGATVTTSGSVATITLSTPSKTFTISKLSAQTRVNSLKVYYEVDSDLVNPEISWSGEDSYSVVLGEEFKSPTLNNPNGLAVSYESSNASVATIDSEGNVSIVGAGNTVISATFDGNETYKASTVSYAITVVDPNSVSTEISVDDFGTTNAYTAYTYTDNYDVAYSTVYYHSSGLMQYNTSSNNGKGSGLNITANNSDYIVKYIDIEFASGGSGVNIYASSTPFDALAKTTTPNYSSYTKVNANPITSSTTNISINAKAFAIIPSASGVIQISKITVHYALDASDTREEVTLSFENNEYEATYGEDFKEPQLTITPDADAIKNLVVYTSEAENVATVNSTTGEVSLVGVGSTVIKAEFAGNDLYKSASASYTLNVTVNVSSLTDFLAAKPETNTVIPEPVTVYYQSPDKKYMFITDGTTNMMVYGTLSNTYQNGDVLTGIVGKYEEYGGMGELIPDVSTFGEATEGTPVEPKATTLAEEIAPCDFVVLKGVDITKANDKNATVTDGTNSIAAYDRFDLAWEATENATIVAIGAVYNSTKQIYIVSVTETPDTREEVTMEFSESELSTVFGADFVEPTLTVAPVEAATEVKYSSSNTEVATVDSTTGNVTILAVGETTIKAEIKDSETYKDVDVSYTLKVIELGEIMFNDFVLDESHQCGAFVGETVTISAANAESMGYTVDAGTAVEVEGSSFTWSSAEVRTYSFSVWAELGSKRKEVSFTVKVSVDPVEYPAYVKVTHAPVNDNWAGRYLIVYEAGNVAFDGSLDKLDVVGNGIEVEISEGYIKATDELANSEFTIAAIEGSENAWSVKSASNAYIGRSNDDNGLDTDSSKELQNTINIDTEQNVNIIGEGGAYLRYNSASNQIRFRYYKTSSYTSQKPIALYKYAEGRSDDSTAIEEIESSEAAEAQWYDLNGRRVAAPGKGIYILKQGNKATKYAF